MFAVKIVRERRRSGTSLYWPSGFHNETPRCALSLNLGLFYLYGMRSHGILKPATLLFLILTAFVNCGIKQPVEKGDFKDTHLIELIRVDSTFKLDIRYATSNNLVGRPVYNEARAFLQYDAAHALARVNQSLRKGGLGLLIFDGYRPWSVTKLFWDITPKQNKQFVADPRKGSKHNRGCAVDLSLFDLATGKEIEMTGAYDEMTERSYPDYKGGTEKQKAMRDLLRQSMEAEGFQVYEFEWWHFDFKDWQKYRIGNIPFDQIK